MKKPHLRGALALAGVISAAVVVGTRLEIATGDPEPSGSWTLYQIEEDDGAVHGAPTTVVVKYVIDAVAHTVVNEWHRHTEATPYESTTFTYTVEENGNWYFADAGPGGRTETISVSQTGDELTFTRIAYSGPDCVTAPAAVYSEGGSPPPDPGTVPPPKKLFMRR